MGIGNYLYTLQTAFSPGPGMGLFQFTRTPFGLSNAPGSFQRLMDTVCRGLPFVTTYLDDVLVHSESVQQHEMHLRQVFEHLQQAGHSNRPSQSEAEVSVRFVKSGLCRSCFLRSRNVTRWS